MDRKTETLPKIYQEEVIEKNGEIEDNISATLNELGLTTAAEIYKRQKPLILKEMEETEISNRKIMIAKERYRYITPENFREYDNMLKEKTTNIYSANGWRYTEYVKTKFVNINKYESIPPKEVLDKLKEAKKLACFDSFEIAILEKTTTKREIKPVKLPDPLLLGCIKGSDLKFFITQWDNDIKIEDILKENEG